MHLWTLPTSMGHMQHLTFGLVTLGLSNIHIVLNALCIKIQFYFFKGILIDPLAPPSLYFFYTTVVCFNTLTTKVDSLE